MDAECSVWMLFDEAAEPHLELEALDHAADALRERLDTWLGHTGAEA